MTKPDYLGAAAWCEDAAGRFSAAAQYHRGVLNAKVRRVDLGDEEGERVALEHAAHATVALSCVRAMQAWSEGLVGVRHDDDGRWCAWVIGTNLPNIYAPDPLTAITMALTEAGDA